MKKKEEKKLNITYTYSEEGQELKDILEELYLLYIKNLRNSYIK